MTDSKSSKPWVWVFLVLLLGLFAAGILYLDRQIVKTSEANATKPKPESQRIKPTIDFYSVLPDRKVDLPVSKDEREGIDNPSINKVAGGQFILQVGSFQTAGDADSLKAQLAFLGLEAKVHSANVNSATWYRVELGPFASNSHISRAKNLLLENRIQYMQRSVTQ